MNITQAGNTLAKGYIIALMKRQGYSEVAIADVLESWKEK